MKRKENPMHREREREIPPTETEAHTHAHLQHTRHTHTHTHTHTHYTEKKQTYPRFCRKSLVGVIPVRLDFFTSSLMVAGGAHQREAKAAEEERKQSHSTPSRISSRDVRCVALVRFYVEQRGAQLSVCLSVWVGVGARDVACLENGQLFWTVLSPTLLETGHTEKNSCSVKPAESGETPRFPSLTPSLSFRKWWDPTTHTNARLRHGIRTTAYRGTVRARAQGHQQAHWAGVRLGCGGVVRMHGDTPASRPVLPASG
jgi:hypothetical protein